MADLLRGQVKPHRIPVPHRLDPQRRPQGGLVVSAQEGMRAVGAACPIADARHVAVHAREGRLRGSAVLGHRELHKLGSAAQPTIGKLELMAAQAGPLGRQSRIAAQRVRSRGAARVTEAADNLSAYHMGETGTHLQSVRGRDDDAGIEADRAGAGQTHGKVHQRGQGRTSEDGPVKVEGAGVAGTAELRGQPGNDVSAGVRAHRGQRKQTAGIATYKDRLAE